MFTILPGSHDNRRASCKVSSVVGKARTAGFVAAVFGGARHVEDDLDVHCAAHTVAALRVAYGCVWIQPSGVTHDDEGAPITTEARYAGLFQGLSQRGFRASTADRHVHRIGSSRGANPDTLCAWSRVAKGQHVTGAAAPTCTMNRVVKVECEKRKASAPGSRRN